MHIKTIRIVRKYGIKMGRYDDIINLPYHKSKTKKHMSAYERAAQFSPFAALTGHDLAIKETSRLTTQKLELDEYQKERINQKLLLIFDNKKNSPQVKITYYLKDKFKEGGEYISVLDYVKHFDEYQKTIITSDNTVININDIYDIQGDFFTKYNLD